jgi:sialate O-acetylesterase
MRATLAAALLALFGITQAQQPESLTAEQDHRRLLQLLKIESLRPGADGRDVTAPNAANYDESKANPFPHLPDPLRAKSGAAVRSPAQWQKRRAEILEDFDREIYGRVPADVPAVTWSVKNTRRETIGGVPVLTKQLVGHVDNAAYRSVSVDIQLTLTTPTNTVARVPVMMQLIFTNLPQASPPSPTPQEQALAQGWGFALLVPTSIQPDSGADLTRGIIGLANRGQPRDLDDWGALRAWAWGASRALDYLETDAAVDAKHVGIEGLSRYGKAALVAMAYDTRFAIGLVASSGAGGAKLHRRNFGELVENLAAPSEYHWMAGNYLKYAGPLEWDDLPVDSHELIALCAPRPVFISVGAEAVEGGWVDARGMFMAAAAAGPVYRLLGAKDLGTSEFPAQEASLTDGDLAFRQHGGGHTAAPNWPTFVRFAKRYLPSPLPLMSPLFRDHAVLQRDQPVNVWGWARPGADVTLSFASTSTRATANPAGRWDARIPAMPAGGPYVLTARTEGDIAETARDVMVGDVWLCSGQSNMVLQVHRSLDSRAEIANSANDRIRMLTIPLVSSEAPREVFDPAPWLVSSPANTPEFSATCYYFARELQKTIDVPMGLVNASWGGANIQTWMSDRALRGIGRNDGWLDVLKLRATDPMAASKRWGEMWQSWWPGPGQPWKGDGTWQPAPQALGFWENWNVRELANFNGMVWYRTAVRLDAAQAKQRATLTLGPIDEVDNTWLNGVFLGTTSGAGTDRIYEIAPGRLRAGENVIVVNALDTYATGGIHGPADKRAIRLADGSKIALAGPWSYQIAPSNLTSPRAPWDPTGGMTVIHNAMIAPLVPYGFRGVVWYQGESNTEDAGNYEALLGRFMADWREKFGKSLPFLIVQLAGYGPAATAPYDSGWARLRQAQRDAVDKDEHAALAVTIDIGERTDVHPANKQELGRRLARAARHEIYGETSLPPSGPVPLTAAREGDHVIVTFRDVTGELIVYGGARPTGFELCGNEQATCTYVDGSAQGASVQLLIPPDTMPTRVRYCWADSPVCTLYDKAGLPAGPFEIGITSPTSSHLRDERSATVSARTESARRASRRG